MNRVLPRLVLAAIACSTLDARATIVVDPGGQGDVTTLQAALALAADGELILLKAGSYESAPGGGGFTIDGRGVALVAEAGAQVTLPWLAIRNVPAGSSVIVRGLSIDPSSGNPKPTRPGVEIADSAGSVWLEDCEIRGADGWWDDDPVSYGFIDGQRGVSVSWAQAVLERCSIVGGKGGPVDSLWWTSGGAAGVWVNRGRASLHDCDVTGGAGGDGQYSSQGSFDGGAGVGIWVDAFASIAGGTTTGGAAGHHPYVNSYSGCGALAYSASSFAWIRDGAFAAGEAEFPDGPGEPVGALKNETITSFAAPSRSFSISSSLREGEAGTLQVHGVQGDQLFLLAAPGVGFSKLLGKQGVLALESPALLPVALGTITDPQGALTLPFVAPHLLPGVDGLVTLMQLGVVRDGVTTLEGGSAFVWLSANL